jgi:hypothetical protein
LSLVLIIGENTPSLIRASKPVCFLMKISLKARSWRSRMACIRTSSSSARNMAISARSLREWLSSRRSAMGLSSIVSRRPRNWIIWPTVTESS